MSKMIGFPEKKDFISAGAWIAGKARNLAGGRFEGAAALFASDPAQGHKGGIRCNQVQSGVRHRRHPARMNPTTR